MPKQSSKGYGSIGPNAGAPTPAVSTSTGRQHGLKGTSAASLYDATGHARSPGPGAGSLPAGRVIGDPTTAGPGGPVNLGSGDEASRGGRR